jgi:hypothetical protein
MKQSKLWGTGWLMVGTLACLVLTAVGAQAAITDGLVSYWPLDGHFQDVWDDNDGTLMGTDTTANFASGAFGQGIDLDGIDQYVEITGGDESEFDFEAGDLSVSSWFRVDAFDTSWQALIAKGEGARWRVARRDASSVMSYAGGTGDIPTASDIGPAVDDGALHHLVAISENGVSTRLWVDGQLVATGDAPTLENGDQRLRIGDNPDTDPNRSWNGLIDDVAIWDRVLTEDEIGAIYNGGQGMSIGGMYLVDVTSPTDALVQVDGIDDDDGSAGPPPAAEGVENAINNVTQKYLNFLDLGSGFIVTPETGATVVEGIRLYTANDAIERDPASFVLEGSNSGPEGPFTVIAEGDLSLPEQRNEGGDIPIDPSLWNQTVLFDNDQAYTSYRVTFPTLRDAAAANSMQIADVELLGVPEPSGIALAVLGLLGLCCRGWRRRRC